MKTKVKVSSRIADVSKTITMHRKVAMNMANILNY